MGKLVISKITFFIVQWSLSLAEVPHDARFATSSPTTLASATSSPTTLASTTSSPTTLAYADPCSVCDERDKDVTQSGISDKCYNEISDWIQISGKKIPKKCDDVDGWATAKCIKAVFSMLKCSINPCEDDYDNKFKYGNDMYSCKQLNRSKKIHRRKICKRKKSARKLCKMICKYKS